MSGIVGDGSVYTCKHLMRVKRPEDCVFCHRDQLRGNLSLAEEGLANYAQENERLKTELLEVNKALGLPRETESNAERVKAALRLRTALHGITSCSTCEVCRGAAASALGAPPQTEKLKADRNFGVEDGYKPGWTEDT